MDLFDKKGGLQDTVGAHPTKPIPAELSWDNLGAGILAGVEKRKKKRRLLIWWWGGGLSLLSLSFLLFFTQISRTSIEALPIPLNGEAFTETTENANQLKNNKEVKRQAAKEKMKKTANQKITLKNEQEQVSNYQIAQKHPLTAVAEQDNLTVEIEQPINNQKMSQNVDNQPKINGMEPLFNLPIITGLLEGYSTEEIIPAPVIPVSKGNWHLAISGGTNWWQYGYKGAEDEIIPTTLSGWQADLRISKEITNKLSIKTGLGIQQLRFRSNYTGTKEVIVFQPNTIDTIFTSALTGQQTFTYRDSVRGIQTRNFQHYNRHTSLQIPLLLSYQISKQRWTLAIQTGIAIQFIPKISGKLAMTDGTIIDLENTDRYPKNIRWSHLLETQVGYHATPNLTIFARYGLENHLTNWIEKDLSYQQQPRVMSLNLGLSYRLQ